jgi:hypothetical protein
MLDGIPGEINEKQTKLLTVSKNNTDRLARLIDDLLDVAKIESGRMEYRKQRVDLPGVISQAVVSAEPLARQKGLEIVTRLPKGRLDVFADADRLMQVLTNLVGNAIKFTEKGEVCVSAVAKDTVVECAVEDTGVGIPREDIPRLFHKFVQVRRRHGAGQKGTGLGLVIAKNIVESHRGKIWVESESNRGSRFVFQIPAYTEEEVIREKVAERILDARQSEQSFTLFLIRLECKSRMDEEMEALTLQRGIVKLLDERSLVRTSDDLMARGERELVIMAGVDPKEMPFVFDRWMAHIAKSFADTDEDLAIEPACGYAKYPDDGKTAEELLGKAGKQALAV